jgi:hypothetical protein
MPSADNSYTVASLGFNFAYAGTVYTQVSISTNGYVCLGSISCSSTTRPSNTNVIVGLNADLDTARSESGQIYYQRLSSGSSNFISAQSTVNLLNPSFSPTNIFMITYDKVLHHSGTYNTTVMGSFQIFLLTDSASYNSYVIFMYASCLNGIGLNVPSGLAFTTASNFQQVTIANQCASSNVGRTGKWVMSLTSLSKKKV